MRGRVLGSPNVPSRRSASPRSWPRNGAPGHRLWPRSVSLGTGSTVPGGRPDRPRWQLLQGRASDVDRRCARAGQQFVEEPQQRDELRRRVARPGRAGSGDRLGHGHGVWHRTPRRRRPARWPSGSGGRSPAPRRPSSLRPDPGAVRRPSARASRTTSVASPRSPASFCPEREPEQLPRVRTDRRHRVDERLEEGAVPPLGRPPVDVPGDQDGADGGPRLAIPGLDRRHPAEHRPGRNGRSSGTTTGRWSISTVGRSTRGASWPWAGRLSSRDPRDEAASGRLTGDDPDPRGPTRIRSEPRMALLDRRVVHARRSNARGRHPPCRGRPDLLVAAERVAHDRAGLPGEVGRRGRARRRVRPAPAGGWPRRGRASRPAGGPRAAATSTTGSIQPPAWVGAATLDERPGRRGRIGDLARAGGQERSGTGVDRRVGRGWSTTSPRRPGEQDGGDVRPRVEPAERVSSRAGRGSSERASPAARSDARTPSGRSAASRPTPSRTRSRSSAGSPVSITETATSTSASSDVRGSIARSGSIGDGRPAATGTAVGDGRPRCGSATVRPHRGAPPSAAAADRCDAATSGRRSAMARATVVVRLVDELADQGDRRPLDVRRRIGQRVRGHDGGSPGVVRRRRHRRGRRGPGRPSPFPPAPRRGPARSGRAGRPAAAARRGRS